MCSGGYTNLMWFCVVMRPIIFVVIGDHSERPKLSILDVFKRICSKMSLNGSPFCVDD